MKVLFLSNAASIHTVRWVNALANRGHEIHLVFKKDDQPRDNEISNKVILHSLKYGGNKAYFTSAFELHKLYKKIKPDVVNAHYASGYGTLARIAKLKPLILSVWGSDVYDFPYQSKIKMNLIKKNLLYADKIASTSNCMADQVRKLLNSNSVDITVTPFGVDIEKFSRKNESQNKEKICIGNIKTLAPKYGITDLIKAVRILKDNLVKKGLREISDNIVVQIYGDGMQREEILDLIKQLQLEDTVELKGRIPNHEVPAALEKMDIFCLTSVFESFGVSAVEAMALELPVVATDVDGFKEVVENDVTGIIVQRKNPAAIAKALEKLVLNKETRLEMGKNGRNRVIELYDWNRNVDTMLELYKSIS
ncbi:MAG TPA: glycosyltransferase family 4 protein [Thermoanaerobacter sp.]|nr:glycosyltransferase family 4 protein [Thermoanaerobacter sp.]